MVKSFAINLLFISTLWRIARTQDAKNISYDVEEVPTTAPHHDPIFGVISLIFPSTEQPTMVEINGNNTE